MRHDKRHATDPCDQGVGRTSRHGRNAHDIWSFVAGASTRALHTAMAAVLVLPSTLPAYAQSPLPQGGAVASGAATISTPNATTMRIDQSSQRAVVNWYTFSIGQGASVEFRQPGAGAATLNRVTGGATSSIAGQLSGNGQVFLVNPNGIAITPTGTVNLGGGFVASTLDITNDDFNAGRLRFNGGGASAGVVNGGRITVGSGGFAALIGGSVDNDGAVSVPLGRIGLGAGEQATLDLSGDGFLQVAVPSSTLPNGKALVTNAGTIEAAGGRIELKVATVRGAIRDAVNVPGRLSARSATGRDGAIVLGGGGGGRVEVSGRATAGRSVEITGHDVTIAGTVDARGNDELSTPAGVILIEAINDVRLEATGRLLADGTIGGRIDITGRNVDLAGAAITATGSEQGGLIRVGGAFRGGKETDTTSPEGMAFVGRFGALQGLASADTTSIDGATTIDVSSTQPRGLAGTVIVWSRSRTDVAGTVRAQDELGGGAVELSSRGLLGALNLAGVAIGPGGRLLLDPKDIYVTNSGPFDSPGSYPYDGTSAFTVLSAQAISDLLVTSGVDVTLQASNDIIIGAPIGFTSTGVTSPKFGDFTLSAGRSVEIDALLLLNSFTDLGNRISITANDPAAVGERDPGDASIRTRRIEAGTDGDIAITMAAGAPGTAGDIRLGQITARSLTVTHAGDSTSPRPWITVTGDVTTRMAQSYSGNLVIAPAGITPHIDLRSLEGNVSWATEATSAISAEEFPSTVSFYSSGTQIRHGFLKVIANGLEGFDLAASDATRLALGPDPGVTVSSIYGSSLVSSPPTGAPWRIVRGALQGTDTASDVTGFSFQIINASTTANVGDASFADVVLPPGSTFSFSSTASPGYFIDLRSGVIPVVKTPRTLTPLIAGSTQYTYGAPSPVVTFSGLLARDNGEFYAQFDVPSAGGYASANDTDASGGLRLDAKLPAGTHAFTFTSIESKSLRSATNYVIAAPTTTSGTFKIDPKKLTVACCDQTLTYGNTGSVSLSFEGVLAGDDVRSAAIDIFNASTGGAQVLTDRTGVGTYRMQPRGLAGAQAGNYAFDFAGASSFPSLTIDPRVYFGLPVTAANWTYGDAPPTRSFGGELAGDEVYGVFADRATGSVFTQRSPAGTFMGEIRIGGASAANYVLDAPILPSVTIAKRRVTTTYGTTTVTYGDTHGAVPGPVLGNVLAGDDVTAIGSTNYAGVTVTSLPADAESGTYFTLLSGLGGAHAANYDFTITGSGRVIIEPRLLSYTIAPATYTYGDDAIKAHANVTLSNLAPHHVGGVNPIVSVTDGGGVTRTLDTRAPAGTYTARVSGLDISSNNYVIPAGSPVAGVTIDKRTLGYAFSRIQGAYGSGATVGGLDAFSALPNGEFAFLTLQVTDKDGNVVSTTPTGGGLFTIPTRTNAGDYTVSATGVVAAGGTGFNPANYTLDGLPRAFRIDPKPITYMAQSLTRTYGSVSAPRVDIDGVLSGDVVTPVVGLSGPNTGASEAQRDVGQYTIAASGLAGASASNYTIAASGNVDGILTVTPREIDWRIADHTRVYGPNLAFGAVTLANVVADDDVRVTGVTAFSLLADTLGQEIDHVGYANAGIYRQAPTGLTGSRAFNYTVDPRFQSGRLTIDRRPVTVEVPTFTREFHQGVTATQPTAYTGITDFLPGDDVGIVVSAPASRADVGTYPMNAFLTGSRRNNYTIVASTLGAYVIAPTRLVFEPGTPATIVSTYGDPPPVDISWFQAVADGARIYMPNTVALHSSGQPNTRTPVGLFDLLRTLQDKTNFTLVEPGPRLLVEPRPVTIPPLSVVYGDAPPLVTQLDNVVNGDEITARIAAFAGRDVDRIWNVDGSLIGTPPNAGTYTIQDARLSGSNASNYRFAPSPVPGLTITPRPITVASIDDVRTTYGDVPQAFDAAQSSHLLAAGGRYLQFGVTFANLVTPSHAAELLLPMGDSLNEADGNAVAITDRVGAGTYTWSPVAGATPIGMVNCLSCAAGNYVLADTGHASANVIVDPRIVGYQIPDAAAVYGEPLTQTVTLSNVLPRDVPDLGVAFGIQENNVFVNGALLAVSGGSHTGTGMDYAGELARAPAGTYGVRLQALTGTAAGNYRVADMTTPIPTLAISPKPLTYAAPTFESLHLFGMVDSFVARLAPEWTTLDGVLPGDSVAATLGVSTAPGSTPTLLTATGAGNFDVGTYPVVATGLYGPHARNYVIASAGNVPGALIVRPFFGAGLFDDLPFIDVEDTFRQALLNSGSKPSTGLPDTTNPSTGGGTSTVTVPGDGRPTTGVGAGVSAGTGFSSGDYSGEALAEARASFDAWSTTPVDLSAGVSGNVTAERTIETTCGGEPCSISTSGHLSGYASLSARFDLLTGFQSVAETGASAGAQAEFLSGCGNATCVVSGGVVANVGAQASAEASWDNGVSLGAGAGAIAGVSARGRAGVSGGGGSLSGGAGASTGKVGAGGGASVGMEDWELQLNFNLSLHLGIFGVDLDLGLGLDLGDLGGKVIGQWMEAAGEAISDAFRGKKVRYRWDYEDPIAAQAQLGRFEYFKFALHRARELQLDVARNMLRDGGDPELYRAQIEQAKSMADRLIEAAAAENFIISYGGGNVTLIDPNPPKIVRKTEVKYDDNWNPANWF